MSMGQIKNSFDVITKNKIVRGLLIAMTGGAAIAGLDFIGAVDFQNPVVASLIATLVPAAVNAVREWSKGE